MLSRCGRGPPPGSGWTTSGRSTCAASGVVRDVPETVHVATKVPPKNLTWPAPAGVAVEEVFPGDHVRTCAERSLRNLGLETIELLQLHVWQDDWLGQGDWLETVQAAFDCTPVVYTDPSFWRENVAGDFSAAQTRS